MHSYYISTTWFAAKHLLYISQILTQSENDPAPIPPPSLILILTLTLTITPRYARRLFARLNEQQSGSVQFGCHHTINVNFPIKQKC